MSARHLRYCFIDGLYEDSLFNIYRHCVIFFYLQNTETINSIIYNFCEKNSYYQELTKETILSSLHVYQRIMEGNSLIELYINNSFSLVAVKRGNNEYVYNFLHYFQRRRFTYILYRQSYKSLFPYFCMKRLCCHIFHLIEKLIFNIKSSKKFSVF